MRKELLQKAGLEVFAIVFSVLFALFLSNWWEQTKIEAGHYKTLDLIEAELQANKAELEEAIAYYDEVSAAILKVRPDGITREESIEVMESCCQLNSGGSHLTAHETAILTGLYAWLEPASAAKIMSPFVGQKELNESAKMISSLVLDVDLEDRSKFFERYLILVQSLRPSLLEVLDATNEGLDEVAETKARR